jgi:hypothetical protein
VLGKKKVASRGSAKHSVGRICAEAYRLEDQAQTVDQVVIYLFPGCCHDPRHFRLSFEGALDPDECVVRHRDWVQTDGALIVHEACREGVDVGVVGNQLVTPGHVHEERLRDYTLSLTTQSIPRTWVDALFGRQSARALLTLHDM